jgi:hypothetical protein
MGTNPLTATAEATQFPKNWGLYWTLRMQHAFSIEEACKAMCEAQYEGWTENLYLNPAILKGLRKLEMLCNALECCEPAPCKCPRCQ